MGITVYQFYRLVNWGPESADDLSKDTSWKVATLKRGTHGTHAFSWLHRNFLLHKGAKEKKEKDRLGPYRCYLEGNHSRMPPTGGFYRFQTAQEPRILLSSPKLLSSWGEGAGVSEGFWLEGWRERDAIFRQDRLMLSTTAGWAPRGSQGGPLIIIDNMFFFLFHI